VISGFPQEAATCARRRLTAKSKTRNILACFADHVQVTGSAQDAAEASLWLPARWADVTRRGLGEWLALHPVFRAGVFGEFLAKRGSRNVRTRDSLLAHYISTGRLLRVRRGLYAVVPSGQTPKTVQPDPFLLAAGMTPDAVLAYHTALEFHGRAYSTFREFTYLTSMATRPAEFRGNTFRGVAFPRSLVDRNQESFGVETGEREGLETRVTSPERTLVDVLDRPAISGGWEEIWRSLESVEYYDLDRIGEYVLMLDNATTVAKVGFYLEQHAEQLMVEDSALGRLRTHVPKKPHYLDRSTREPAHLIEPWNLIVPQRILSRTWEEIR
jgi:predicted transcriptional regulator of viral defense system